MGKFIAESLSYACTDAEIFYICSETAEVPDIKHLTIYRVKGVADLEDVMFDLFQRIQFEIIIQAMAISDYTVANVTCPENIYNTLLEQNIKSPEDIKTLFQSESISLSAKQKINSAHDELILVLKKTPKIIGMIREKQPECILVGFKLMVGVTKDALKVKALNLLEENNCDLVFANDLHDIININVHKGILVKANGSHISTTTKQNSAKLIAEESLECLEHKRGLN